MTIKKKQTKQSKTEVGLAPVSLADALTARHKEIEKQKKKSTKGTLGGARPGAGRPLGSHNKGTIEMKLAREMMQQAIASKTNQLLTTQLRMAMGSSSLWMRWQEEVMHGRLVNGNQKKEKVWRARKITDDADYMIYFSLDHQADGRAKDKSTGIEYYYLQESKGDHQAVVNLLDRAYGKPKESVEIDTPPPEPMGVANTGTTVVLREKFVDMIKRTIIEGEVTDAK